MYLHLHRPFTNSLVAYSIFGIAIFATVITLSEFQHGLLTIAAKAPPASVLQRAPRTLSEVCSAVMQSVQEMVCEHADAVLQESGRSGSFFLFFFEGELCSFLWWVVYV